MNSHSVILKLIKYFGAEVIGSALLPIPTSEASDYDVQIPEDQYQYVENYLIDKGFKTRGYGSSGFNCVRFDYPENKSIDVHKKTEDVWTIEKLVGYKFERGSDNDLRQIIRACQHKMDKNNTGGNNG